MQHIEVYAKMLVVKQQKNAPQAVTAGFPSWLDDIGAGKGIVPALLILIFRGVVADRETSCPLPRNLQTTWHAI
jgi:hypothetical protein